MKLCGFRSVYHSLNRGWRAGALAAALLPDQLSD
jgi:hypothetical protein